MLHKLFWYMDAHHSHLMALLQHYDRWHVNSNGIMTLKIWKQSESAAAGVSRAELKVKQQILVMFQWTIKILLSIFMATCMCIFLITPTCTGFSPSDIWDKLQHPNHTFVSVVVMILDNYWIAGIIAPIYSRVNHYHET